MENNAYIHDDELDWLIDVLWKDTRPVNGLLDLLRYVDAWLYDEIGDIPIPLSGKEVQQMFRQALDAFHGGAR